MRALASFFGTPSPACRHCGRQAFSAIRENPRASPTSGGDGFRGEGPLLSAKTRISLRRWRVHCVSPPRMSRQGHRRKVYCGEETVGGRRESIVITEGMGSRGPLSCLVSPLQWPESLVFHGVRVYLHVNVRIDRPHARSLEGHFALPSPCLYTRTLASPSASAPKSRACLRQVHPLRSTPSRQIWT